MSEQQQVPETTVAPEAQTEIPTAPEAPKIDPLTQAACDIAAGRTPAGHNASGKSIVGAKKDLNSKGRGLEWYRMVYRGGWQYVSDEWLPSGSFRASDRRAEIYGDVYPGEIVVAHDRGKPVDLAWLARTPSEASSGLIKINFRSRRDGQLVFTLPDGSEVVLPNPRKK